MFMPRDSTPVIFCLTLQSLSFLGMHFDPRALCGSHQDQKISNPACSSESLYRAQDTSCSTAEAGRASSCDDHSESAWASASAAISVEADHATPISRSQTKP